MEHNSYHIGSILRCKNLGINPSIFKGSGYKPGKIIIVGDIFYNQFFKSYYYYSLLKERKEPIGENFLEVVPSPPKTIDERFSFLQFYLITPILYFRGP